jgi:hypothetical protein
MLCILWNVDGDANAISIGRADLKSDPLRDIDGRLLLPLPFVRHIQVFIDDFRS